jgi:hypothetical protein
MVATTTETAPPARVIEEGEDGGPDLSGSQGLGGASFE